MNFLCCARKRRAYPIRISDGRILYGRQYYSLKAILHFRQKGKERYKEYYKLNREKFRERSASWNKKNKERRRFLEKKSKILNKVKVNETSKQYRIRNKERIKKRCEENKESIRKYHKEWWGKYGKERTEYRYPSRIINHAISEYRSGEIGIDEFNRRIDEAIKRTNDLDHSNGKARRKSFSKRE